jgi:predicted DNA repair protein MutK
MPQQVSGVRAERELPVVWAVAVGSLKNKLILVPAALAISRFMPWAVTPLLMLGGLYLCLEGVEKLAHKWLQGAGGRCARHAEELAALADETVDMAVRGRQDQGGHPHRFRAVRRNHRHRPRHGRRPAVRSQVAVLSGIGLIMTVGVYGIVAGIVKMDDIGSTCCKKTNVRAGTRWSARACCWRRRG